MANPTLFTPDSWRTLTRAFGPIRRDMELPCTNHPLGRVLVLDVTETTRGVLLHWIQGVRFRYTHTGHMNPP
jgi:hypothetical protein